MATPAQPIATTVRVTEIGEFIRNRSCERRFKLEYNGRAETRNIPFFDRLFTPLDPVLSEVGRERENEWEQMLVFASVIYPDKHRPKNVTFCCA
jgi:hypothetical protein